MPSDNLHQQHQILSIHERQTITAGGAVHPHASRDDSLPSRRFVLQSLVVGATVLVTAHSDPVRALDDDGVSGPALRKVQSGLKKLQGPAVRGYIEDNDYAALQVSLREAPLSELRKSCTTLIRVRTADQGTLVLQEQYQTVIAALEKLDSQALTAQRGRKLADGEWRTSYDATVQSLSDFVTLATEDSSARSSTPAMATASEGW